MSPQTRSRHEEIITRILSQHPDKWIEAGQAALAKEKEENPLDIFTLQQSMVNAMETEAEKARRWGNILKKDLRLDPEEYPGLFEIFRTKRLAELFKDRVSISSQIFLNHSDIHQPDMVGILKTRALANSYNVGYTKLLKIFSAIAEDPQSIICGYQTLCKLDDQMGVLIEGSLGVMCEAVAAMEYVTENHNNFICALYYDYHTIPTKADWQVAEERIQTRTRRKIDQTSTVTESSSMYPPVNTPPRHQLMHLLQDLNV
jgi:hypothetical protein